jgi:prevent-host-death family protein
MTERVSAARAKAELSTLMSRVAYGGERFLIERHGKPVAALVPAGDLAKLEPTKEQEPKLGLLALVGASPDVSDEDIDRMMEAIYEARARDVPRPVELPDD